MNNGSPFATLMFWLQYGYHYPQPLIVYWFSEGFHDAWQYYHERQMEVLKSIETNQNRSTEYILWTSGLTAEPYLHNLRNLNYTIQIWTNSNVSQIFSRKILFISLKSCEQIYILQMRDFLIRRWEIIQFKILCKTKMTWSSRTLTHYI